MSSYKTGAPFSTYIDAAMFFESEVELGKETIIVPLQLEANDRNSVESVVLADSVSGNGYKLISKHGNGKLENRTYEKVR